MLSQIIIGQFEIQTSNEYFRLWILEDDFFLSTSFLLILLILVYISISIFIFSRYNNIRIWLLHILKILFLFWPSIHHIWISPGNMLVHLPISHWIHTRLLSCWHWWFDVIISWLDIHFLIIDDMSSAVITVDLQESILVVLSLALIGKLHFHKPKTTASLGMLIPHHYSICNNTELFEVFNQIWFLCLECKTTYKEL